MTIPKDNAAPTAPSAFPLAPADFLDPVIEEYKKGVDRTLLIENLKLTVDQRLQKFRDFVEAIDRIRFAAWTKKPAQS